MGHSRTLFRDGTERCEMFEKYLTLVPISPMPTSHHEVTKNTKWHEEKQKRHLLNDGIG